MVDDGVISVKINLFMNRSKILISEVHVLLPFDKFTLET